LWQKETSLWQVSGKNRSCSNHSSHLFGLAVVYSAAISLNFWAISEKVSPCFSKSSSAGPIPQKVSLNPIILMGTGLSSARQPATASPNPPRMLCSSTVTIPRLSWAAWIMIFLSRGFTVWTLITRVSIFPHPSAHPRLKEPDRPFSLWLSPSHPYPLLGSRHCLSQKDNHPCK